VCTLTNDIEILRKRILAVDQHTSALAATRFQLVAQVGDYKKQSRLPIVNFPVEADVLHRAIELGEALHLPVGFARKLSNLLIQESVVAQEGNPPG
jgi:chorismate mutase